MDHQRLGAIEEFVRARTGISQRKQITAQTKLTDDLDLTGIEAETFMKKFFDAFNVDVGDFSFDRYFVNEGSGLILSLVTVLFRKKHGALERVPITVGMLADAAALGRWDSASLEGRHDS
ncbi:DUF1493 family protein [Paraburkholderia sp. Ac-20336]|uniref:DUF1493 family protein n=1 Tax=Burkholderiaceae TaxID=119060 RepID=UPI001422B892|nr:MULTISPECIES: DUF1493 family protein [Burkholderiaceae]MBN3806731.1 DUF1493 family protein [Paraburkholderia sp. Ac-20336]NIF54713.1 DUF1493 family protein [Burkholderia sp. Ax-1724]